MKQTLLIILAFSSLIAMDTTDHTVLSQRIVERNIMEQFAPILIERLLELNHNLKDINPQQARLLIKISAAMMANQPYNFSDGEIAVFNSLDDVVRTSILNLCSIKDKKLNS